MLSHNSLLPTPSITPACLSVHRDRSHTKDGTDSGYYLMVIKLVDICIAYKKVNLPADRLSLPQYAEYMFMKNIKKKKKKLHSL